MNDVVNVGSQLVSVGCGIVSAIAAPEIFLPCFVVGSVIGTTAAIGYRVLSGESIETTTSKDQKKIEPPKTLLILPVGINVMCGGISGSLIYAETVGQAVSSKLSALGGIIAIGLGFGIGLGGSINLTNKIITLIDQRQPKMAQKIKKF